MSVVLYAKYNRTRSRRFQTKIVIEKKDDGTKVVNHCPLNKDACEHIFRIVENYNKYGRTLYSDVSLVKSYSDKNDVYSEYISGRSLIEIICDSMDNIDGMIEEINRYLDIILAVKDKYITEFKLTDGFKKIFGDINGMEDYKGTAHTVCNIDCIFDNYIVNEEKIYLIDYEWLFEAVIPVNYIRYRTVLMFYLTNYTELSSKITKEEFLGRCGISETEQGLFADMEEAFQFYVHDESRRAIYTDRYLKKVTTLDMIDKNIYDLEDSNRDLREYIQKVDRAVAELNRSVEAQRDQIIEQDRQLSEQNTVLSEQKRIIDDQNEKIADMDETIYVLRRERRNPFYAMYRLMRKIGYKILPHRVIRALQIIRNEGIYTCYYLVRQRGRETNDYEKWIIQKEKEEKAAEEKKVLSYRPLISVIMPVYNVSKELLTECIESVIGQSYDNWQLCMADDCSTMPEVKKTLAKYENNPKIDIVYRTENGHISKATNSALEVARGEFIALLDCDDILAENALYEMVKRLNENPELDYIYSDEDKVDKNSKNRHMPHFKPDWSPDTLMSNMYTCHLSLYRKSLVDKAGGLRAGYEGSQDYDLCLRITELIPPSHIAHIPKILYHWRVIKSSTASDTSAKPYILEAAFKAKKDAVARRGLTADIVLIDKIYQYRVNYIPQNDPMVSVIIPSKDNPDIIARCIESLCKLTGYRNYEIIVVDNGSSVDNKRQYEQLLGKWDCRYIYEPEEFNFSRMCNRGAQNAKGEYLLFLNDDIEIIMPEWMERMLGHAQVSYAGAVGAKLLYPDSGLIQHTGVINIMNGPTHAFAGMTDNEIHYFGRNVLEYNYSAVTAACLMVKKDRFNEVGGFDESFAVAYNDVELCFKLVEHGYYNVVRNDVVLYHYESYSRGDDLIDAAKMERLVSERNRLYSYHPDFAPGDNMDPFYNYHLAQNRNDFSCNFEHVQTCTNGYRVRSISDYTECDDITFSVDMLSISDSLKIMGWAFLNKSNRNNSRKLKILLINDETVYEFDTTKVYRPDICLNPQYRRLAMTGFMCQSDAGVLDTGCEYIVALAFGRRMHRI